MCSWMSIIIIFNIIRQFWFGN